MNVATPARVGLGAALAMTALGWLAMPRPPEVTRQEQIYQRPEALCERIFRMLDQEIAASPLFEPRRSQPFDLHSVKAHSERLAYFRMGSR